MLRGPHSTPLPESDLSTARPYLSTSTAWTVPISISVTKRSAAPGRQTGTYYCVQLRHNAPTARGWELHEAYVQPLLLLAMHRVASCCTSGVCRSTTDLDVLDYEDYEHQLRILDLHHAQAPVASAGTVPSGCSGGNVYESNHIGFGTDLNAKVPNDNIDRRACLGSNKVGAQLANGAGFTHEPGEWWLLLTVLARTTFTIRERRLIHNPKLEHWLTGIIDSFYG